MSHIQKNLTLFVLDKCTVSRPPGADPYVIDVRTQLRVLPDDYGPTYYVITKGGSCYMIPPGSTSVYIYETTNFHLCCDGVNELARGYIDGKLLRVFTNPVLWPPAEAPPAALNHGAAQVQHHGPGLNHDHRVQGSDEAGPSQHQDQGFFHGLEAVGNHQHSQTQAPYETGPSQHLDLEGFHNDPQSAIGHHPAQAQAPCEQHLISNGLSQQQACPNTSDPGYTSSLDSGFNQDYGKQEAFAQRNQVYLQAGSQAIDWSQSLTGQYTSSQDGFYTQNAYKNPAPQLQYLQGNTVNNGHQVGDAYHFSQANYLQGQNPIPPQLPLTAGLLGLGNGLQNEAPSAGDDLKINPPANISSPVYYLQPIPGYHGNGIKYTCMKGREIRVKTGQYATINLSTAAGPELHPTALLNPASPEPLDPAKYGKAYYIIEPRPPNAKNREEGIDLEIPDNWVAPWHPMVIEGDVLVVWERVTIYRAYTDISEETLDRLQIATRNSCKVITDPEHRYGIPVKSDGKQYTVVPPQPPNSGVNPSPRFLFEPLPKGEKLPLVLCPRKGNLNLQRIEAFFGVKDSVDSIRKLIVWYSENAPFVVTDTMGHDHEWQSRVLSRWASAFQRWDQKEVDTWKAVIAPPIHNNTDNNYLKEASQQQGQLAKPSNRCWAVLKYAGKRSEEWQRHKKGVSRSGASKAEEGENADGGPAQGTGKRKRSEKPAAQSQAYKKQKNDATAWEDQGGQIPMFDHAQLQQRQPVYLPMDQEMNLQNGHFQECDQDQHQAESAWEMLQAHVADFRGMGIGLCTPKEDTSSPLSSTVADVEQPPAKLTTSLDIGAVDPAGHAPSSDFDLDEFIAVNTSSNDALDIFKAWCANFTEDVEPVQESDGSFAASMDPQI